MCIRVVHKLRCIVELKIEHDYAKDEWWHYISRKGKD